jgi:glycosyltransferase involved in cell wall biosynthesis
MKITHVISDSNVGGAGVLLASIAKRLSSVFDMEIIVPRGSALAERLSGTGATVKELEMVADKSFCAKDARAFYKYFKENPTDVLHTHASLCARLGGAAAGIRSCLSTRHCAIPKDKIKKMSVLKRKVYEYCTDLTISTADFATDNLVSEGIPRSKILTIKNGVEKVARTSAEERRALMRSLGIPDGAMIIGSAARLEAVKGQDLILRAAARLIRRNEDIYVLLVGDGSMKEQYKALAARLGILSKTRFTGYVPSPAEYQNLFYVNVNASRATETSCLATSECMSLGIPTVASDFGGNREMIRSGANGLLFRTDDLFDLEEKLGKIILFPGLRRKLGKGAQTCFKERFSIERMAGEYKELYLARAGARALTY